MLPLLFYFFFLFFFVLSFSFSLLSFYFLFFFSFLGPESTNCWRETTRVSFSCWADQALGSFGLNLYCKPVKTFLFIFYYFPILSENWKFLLSNPLSAMGKSSRGSITIGQCWLRKEIGRGGSGRGGAQYEVTLVARRCFIGRGKTR